MTQAQAQALAQALALVLVLGSGCRREISLALRLPSGDYDFALVAVALADNPDLPVVAHTDLFPAAEGMGPLTVPDDPVRVAVILYRAETVATALGLPVSELPTAVGVSRNGVTPLPPWGPGDGWGSEAWRLRELGDDSFIAIAEASSGSELDATLLLIAGQLRLDALPATDAAPLLDAGDGGGADAGTDTGSDAGTDAGPPAGDVFVDPAAPAGGDGSPGAPFNDIADGIAACTGSPTLVALAPGTYPPVDLPPDCSLQGAGMGLTVIDAAGAGGTRPVTITDAGAAGGLWDLTLTGGNTIASGGGLSVSGGTVSLTRVEITGNLSGNHGGGIRFSGSSAAVVSECNVHDNMATVHGGGVWIDNNSGGSVTITRTVIANNITVTMSGDGGGIMLNGGGLLLLSSLVVGNFAIGGGGGMRDNNGGAVVISSTFADNDASSGTGGGIRCQVGGTTIIGSILWNNVPAQLSGCPLTLSSLVENGEAGAVLSLDPLFVDVVGGDYHLMPLSPARDFMPMVVGAHPIDIDGEARDALPDIGADEFTP